MYQVTVQEVKELRQKTGCGMIQCKEALIRCGGDMEQAYLWLQDRSFGTKRCMFDKYGELQY